VRTSAYRTIGERERHIRVHGLHYIIDEANAHDELLIVDDVFDSGHSIKALTEELTVKMRQNLPQTIRVATPWFKPSSNETDRRPDYYLHETSDWLIFPHELEGLSLEEIREGKTELADIIPLLESPDGA
jgi:hypoxanthine phosphoribosyltransferase